MRRIFVKKITVFVILPFILIAVFNTAVSAYPYFNYTYSIERNALLEPQAYIPLGTVRGEDLGTGRLSSPSDIYVCFDQKIYLADTGNDRILILNRDFTFLKEIGYFEKDGLRHTFNRPQGVFVADNGNIYIADTENGRIVILDENGEYVDIYEKPVTHLIPEGFQYKPKKIAVDYAYRVFVIADDISEGMIELDRSGNFVGFFGAIRVAPDYGDLFWRMIATREQRMRMTRTIPTVYSNLDIDEGGFVYATVSAIDPANFHTDIFVRRLNPMGADVLRRDGIFDPMGDVDFHIKDGYIREPSQFTDVTVRESGIYSVIDRRMGRVFTYDFTGNLLYVFGGKGNNLGQFRRPEAIATIDEKIVVLDGGHEQMVIFGPTEYAAMINEAVALFRDMDYEASEKLWAEVLRHTARSEMAYLGMGRILYRSGEYGEALEYFKLGNNRQLYSEAYKELRKEFINDNFAVFFVIPIAAFIGYFVLKKLVEIKRRKQIYLFKGFPRVEKFKEHILYSRFYIFHPFKAAWELKTENTGSLTAAISFVFAFIFLNILRRQLTGYILNYNVLNELNILVMVSSVLVPLGLWCVTNWAVTTLMEGEGKIKDIAIITGYSMVPLVLINVPLLFLSNIITLEEAAFYHVLDSASIVWFILLLFIGIMTIHQFTIGKTIGTIVIAIVGMGIIVGLSLLFFALLQQMVNFVLLLYNEIALRR